MNQDNKGQPQQGGQSTNPGQQGQQPGHNPGQQTQKPSEKPGQGTGKSWFGKNPATRRGSPFLTVLKLALSKGGEDFSTATLNQILALLKSP
jgi:hypothetical protein